MNIKLLGNRVLIKLDNSDEKTNGGVFITRYNTPDSYSRGIVVAVGQGKITDRGDFVPLGVKVDEKVIFQYGKEIQVEGKTYLLVMEDDIIMIF